MVERGDWGGGELEGVGECGAILCNIPFIAHLPDKDGESHTNILPVEGEGGNNKERYRRV